MLISILLCMVMMLYNLFLSIDFMPHVVVPWKICAQIASCVQSCHDACSNFVTLKLKLKMVRKYIILFELFKKYHSKLVNKMCAESNFCCRFIYMRFNCFYRK